MQKFQFVKTLVGLCEMYDKEATEFVINTYYEIFKDYSIDKFNLAVTECIKTHKYNSLPKPALILESLRYKGVADLINAQQEKKIDYFEETSEKDQEAVRIMVKETINNMNKLGDNWPNALKV